MMNISFTEIPQNKQWVVIYTKSRREKMVSQFCESNGITHFLPLEKRFKRYGRKKTISHVPLFPGYLFSCCSAKERYNLLITHQIAQLLPVKDQYKLLRDLERVFIAQSHGLDLAPCQYFQKGKRVKIIAGPLCGYEGFMQRVKSSQRIILNVDFIHSAASVEVDRADVENL